MKRTLAVVLCLAPLAAPLAARGDHDHAHGTDAVPAQAASAAQAAYLFVFDDATKKLVDLAAAIPEEKFAWRPAEGVRSVGEVVQHSAAAVYFLSILMGATPPEGHPQTFEAAGALEKLSSKAEATASLAKAVAYARSLAENAKPEQLAKEVDFFGRKIDGRTVFLLLEGHFQEHLGQLIAYARMNGVVPPWSQGQGS